MLETCGPCDPPGVTLSRLPQLSGQRAWPTRPGHCWGPYRLPRRTAGGHLAAGRCVAATLWARRSRPVSEGPVALGTTLAAGGSRSLWLSAEGQPLLGSEKDLHWLSAAAWPQLGEPRHLISGSPSKYLRETRYKALWDSWARGRPSFSPHQCTVSVQCLTAHAFFMQGSFSFSLDTLGSPVQPCCPRPQLHTQAPSSLRSEQPAQLTQL